MKCLELQELLALEALGILDRVEHAQLKTLMEADSEAAAEAAAWRDAATAFAAAATDRRRVPAYLRGRILKRIRQTPQWAPTEAPVSAPAKTKSSAGHALAPESLPSDPLIQDESARMTFDYAATAKWLAVPGIEGIRVRILAVNQPQGYRVMVVEVDPGASFPPHHHGTGPEDLFMLSGDLVTEGRTLRPGDHFHAEPGTDHQRLTSPSGCRAIVVEPLAGPQIMDPAEAH